MSSVTRFLDSSIGRKVLMALTGLFLCVFLIVHVSGNMQLFHHDQGLAFNQYSVLMTTFVPIKVVSYLLYATILLHVYNGFRLALRNKASRPVAYGAPKMAGSSSWASNNMALLGLIILIFLITHMANFWYQYKFGDVQWVQYSVDVENGKVISKSLFSASPDTKPHEFIVAGTDSVNPTIKVVVVRDLYDVVRQAFSQTWLVVLYLLGVLALAYHLVHGFQSAFQSLGIRHPSIARTIRLCGIWIFGILIPLLFAAMPVYFFYFA